MNFSLQAYAGHSHRVLDAAFIIDHIFLRQYVDNLTIHRNGHRPGGIDDPVDILLSDFRALDGNDPAAVKSGDVSAGDTGIGSRDLTAGHQFGLLHRFFNGFDGRFNIDHHAFSQAN